MLDVYESYLSREESARAARLRIPHLRRRFTASRGIVRSILSRYTAISPKAVEISYTENGKPILKEEGNLEFNISHSEDVLLCALAVGVPIGVDVEQMRDDVDIDGVARRFFAPREHEDLAKIPKSEQGRAFFRTWTRKEALIKARGSTISELIRHTDVHSDVVEDAEGLRWTIVDLAPEDGFVGAVAAARVPLKIAYYRF
jgi:4'-phosphopantetheinyl transferase